MARKCCVKRCKNIAQPGSRSCGQHGKRKAPRSTGRRVHYVHLDCRVPALLDNLEPLNTAADDEIKIEIRDGGAIVGLPTNRPQMLSFLCNWLNLPGHTIGLLEKLTPPRLASKDVELSQQLCLTARALVLYDLGGEPC
jgi:hypothetical protein